MDPSTQAAAAILIALAGAPCAHNRPPMPDVAFRADRIEKASEEALTRIADFARTNKCMLRIEGYRGTGKGETDATATRRADAVKAFMVQHQVPAANIKTEPKGELTQPANLADDKKRIARVAVL